MPMERSIIDFELVWKKINRTISLEEDFLLSNWLKESSLHQQYFDNVLRFYKEGSGFVDAKAETERAWKALLRKLEKGRIKSNKRIISISIAAAAIILVMSFVFWPKKIGQSLIANKQDQTVQPIHPGTSKATLVLNDGSVHKITTNGNLLLADGGAVISSEGTKLKYTQKESKTKEVKYNTLTIPRGGEFMLQLSDGTKVWLNSETTLRYPVQFAGSERRVELTGEAFFEVTRNEKIPFLVESGNQTVKVLGTEFNISSYKDDRFVYTTLVNGSVEVYSRSRPEVRQFLAPNEQSSLSVSGDQISKRTVDPFQYVAWKDGRFVFNDLKLEDIMNTLSKWYDVDVIFARDDLRNIRFTGNLKRYEDFGEIMKKIEMTHEVEIQIENRKITIK
jgi:transmembrane sensor